MPAAATSTKTSPGPGLGTGRLDNLARPGRSTRTARIVVTGARPDGKGGELVPGPGSCAQRMAEVPLLPEEVEVEPPLRVGADHILVQRHAQARPLREAEVAVDDLRIARRGFLHVRLRKVVEVLLDLEVGSAGGEMERGRGGDRAAHIVGRHQHVVGIRPGGDLPPFEQSADGGQVGLDDVCRLELEELSKLMAGVDPLARGNRDANAARHLGQRLLVFGDR
jgi:hypothetical protein